MEKVALAVMRLQPLHNGHKLLIDTMLAEAQTAVVAIGSIQARNERNPFSYDQRVQMVRALYPDADRVRVLGVADIGAPTPRAWAEYVLKQIDACALPRPTCYYAGNEETFWFKGILALRGVDRIGAGKGISATQIRTDLAAGKSVDDRVPDKVLALIKEWRYEA